MPTQTSKISNHARKALHVLKTPGTAFLCIRDDGKRNRALKEILGGWENKPIVIEGTPTLRSTRLLKLLAAGVDASAANGLNGNAVQLEFSLVVAEALQEFLRDINEGVTKREVPSLLIVLTDVDQLYYDSNIERVILGLVRTLGAWRFLMTGKGIPWYLEKWLPPDAIIGPKNYLSSTQASSAGDVKDLRATLKAFRGKLWRKSRTKKIPGVRSRLKGIDQLLERGKLEESLIQIWSLTEEFWYPPEGRSEPDRAETKVPGESKMAAPLASTDIKDVVEIAQILEVHSRYGQAKACYKFAQELLERHGTKDDDTRYNVRLGLAKCDYVSGKFTQADKAYSEIADDAEKERNYVAASRAEYFRAKIFFHRDWLSDATELLKNTKKRNTKIENEKDRSTYNAYCDFWQGRIEARRKSFCKAESKLEKAKEVFVQNGIRRGEADLHCEIGKCIHEQSSILAAEEDFEKALSIDRVIGYGSAVGHELNRTIAQLSLHGPSEQAEQFLRGVLKDERSTKMNEAAASLWLGKIYVAHATTMIEDAKAKTEDVKAKIRKARTKINEALDSYKNMGMRRYMAACQLALIRLHLCEHRWAAKRAEGEGAESVTKRRRDIRGCLSELDRIIPTLQGNEDLRAEESLMRARVLWEVERGDPSDEPAGLAGPLEKVDQLLDESEQALAGLQAEVCREYLDQIRDKASDAEKTQLSQALPCFHEGTRAVKRSAGNSRCRALLGCLDFLEGKCTQRKFIGHGPLPEVVQPLYGKTGIGLALLHEVFMEFLGVCEELWPKRGSGLLDRLLPKIEIRTDALARLCSRFEKHGVFKQRRRWSWDEMAKKPQDWHQDPGIRSGAVVATDDIQLVDILAILGTLSPRGKGKRAGLRILDAGCGKGRMIPTLMRHFEETGFHIDYVGLDTNSSAIEKARDLFQECLQRLPQDKRDRFRPSFLIGDLDNLRRGLAGDSFEDAQRFDAVVLCNVVHEMNPCLLGSVLTQLCDALRPTGTLIIHDMEGRHIAEHRFVPWEAEEVALILDPIRACAGWEISLHKLLSYTEKQLYTAVVSPPGKLSTGVNWETVKAQIDDHTLQLLGEKCAALSDSAAAIEARLNAEQMFNKSNRVDSKSGHVLLPPDAKLPQLSDAIVKAQAEKRELSLARTSWRLGEDDVLLHEKLRLLWWCWSRLQEMKAKIASGPDDGETGKTGEGDSSEHPQKPR